MTTDATSASSGGMAPLVGGAEPPVSRPNTRGADIPEPMVGAALWTAGLLLASANFMSVLDATITNVSVPNIAGGLAVSPSEGTWTITSYSVAEAITVPLTGWLARRFGTVRVFCVALAMFGVFSFACGFASSLSMLVACRVFQGLSGGPMIPLSQTLLLRIFPKRQAATALALWATTTVVAPIAGPLLGGAICDNVGWSWIFYINVPFALGVAWVTNRMLRSRETAPQRVRIDAVGLGLLVVWVAALQIMLDKGKDLDWFSSPFIMALLVIAVIGFAAFLIWELTEPNPVVDLRVFRHRSFAVACFVMALAYGGFFANNVLVPLWLQTNLGYTATWAGRATAFAGILAVAASPLAGRMVGRFDPRLLLTFGIGWMAMTFAWRAGFASNVDFLHIIVPQFLQGLGIPFFFISVMALGTASLPPGEVAAGAGLISFVRTVAGSFGVSVLTTSWENATQSARVAMLNQQGSSDQAMALLQKAGLGVEQARRQFEAMMQSQATMVATDHMFLTLALVLLVASGTAWLAKRPGPRLAAPPHGH